MLIAGARVLLPGGFEYVDVRTSGDRIAEIGTVWHRRRGSGSRTPRESCSLLVW